MKPNHRREPFAVFGIINIQYASFACIGITVGSGSVTDVLDCLIRESISTLLRPRNDGARDPAQAHQHQAATFFFDFDHNDFPTVLIPEWLKYTMPMKTGNLLPSWALGPRRHGRRVPGQNGLEC